jgi:hypothetical protein
VQNLAAVTTAATKTSLGTSVRRAMLLVATRSRVSLVAALFVAVACGDSPTAPPPSSIDRAEVARVMPSLTDARTRLVPAIDNAVVRERTEYDLAQLEQALNKGDGQQARFHLRVTSNLLKEYNVQDVSQKDAADVSAIALMLRAVAQAVGGDYDIAFP